MSDEHNRKDDWPLGWTLREIEAHIVALEKQVRELQGELSKLKQHESETFQGWNIIDFYWYAREHYSPDLTKEQCMIVGNYVDRYYDATVGISYDNLWFFIEEAIKQQGWEVEPMDFYDRPDVTEEDSVDEHPDWY